MRGAAGTGGGDRHQTGTPNSDTHSSLWEASPGKCVMSGGLRQTEGTFLGRLLQDPCGPWGRSRESGRRLNSRRASCPRGWPGALAVLPESAVNDTQRPVLLGLTAVGGLLPDVLCRMDKRPWDEGW